MVAASECMLFGRSSRLLRSKNTRDTLFHDVGRPVTNCFSHLRRSLPPSVPRATMTATPASVANDARVRRVTENAAEFFDTYAAHAQQDSVVFSNRASPSVRE